MNRSTKFGFIFIFCFSLLRLEAQGIYDSTDHLQRSILESSLLLKPQDFFTGFRPTSFEIPNLDYATLRERDLFYGNGLGRLSFASLRESRQKIAFTGSEDYPTYQSLSRERSLGLEIPRGENAWMQIEIQQRPTDWLYLQGSIHGGLTLSHLRNSGHKELPGWYHPETLFAEARWNSFILSVGRKPLYWGQLETGALILSDNATSFDGVQISTLPQRWPWFFKYLGPLKAETFVARLSDDRDNPHDWFTGFRLGTQPFDLFEMNASMMYQFGGDKAEDSSFTDILVEVLGGRVEKGAGVDDVSTVTNRSVSLDFRLNLSNLAWPTSIYWENYLEDCCGSMNDILTKSYGYAVGVYTFTQPTLAAHKFRLEYIRLPNSTYWNGSRKDGWTNESTNLGNPVGRDSDRVKFSWEKRLMSWQTTLLGSAFFQRRLITGKLVKSDIRSLYPDFETENILGFAGGFSWDFDPKASLDFRSLVSRFSNRDNLKGATTYEWAALLRVERRF